MINRERASVRDKSGEQANELDAILELLFMLRRDRRRHTSSSEYWVNLATRAAMEAAREVARQPNNTIDDRIVAAGKVFHEHLPPLRDASSIHGYVACVAQGLMAGWVSSAQAQSMMQMANIAILTMWKHRNSANAVTNFREYYFPTVE